jgi:FAD:protein FMN transferase
VDRTAGTIELPATGMALDLGGIAKGYALERAAAVLKRFGIRNALVNAGGDVLVLGEKQSGVPWRVGIQDPRAPKDVLGMVHTQNRFVLTSGDYERRLEVGGKIYHHILDPRTGFPAEGLQSVTVVADDARRADGLSTGVFVLGLEKGTALINGLRGTAALLVDAHGQTTISKNAQGLFELRR